MFFSSESVEQLGMRFRLTGATNSEGEQAAQRYAAQWRHGMAGNSPLYMPGFFAVGVLTWLWALGRPLPRIALEGVALIIAATAVAILLTPWGAALAIQGYIHANGMRGTSALYGFTPVGAAQAVYTVITWSAFILCLQLSIARRSVLPMLAPLVLTIILVSVRTWTVSDFVAQWMQDAGRGQPAATLSFVAAISLLVFLIIYQVRRETDGR
jgi:hypothetical protein